MPSCPSNRRNAFWTRFARGKPIGTIMGLGTPSQIEAASRPNRSEPLGSDHGNRTVGDDGGVTGDLCGAFVVLEQPAETLVAHDTTVADGFRWFDQLVPEPLMVPLSVIMSKVLGTGSSERSFAEKDELVQALALDRENESLRKCVQVGAAAGKFHVGDAGVLKDPEELISELIVSIVDQQPLVAEKAINAIHKVPSDLSHECHRRVGGDAGDLHTTRGEFPDEEHIVGEESLHGPDLDGEEVRGGKHVPVCSKEVTPTCSLAPLGSGNDPVFLEDVGDSASTHNGA